MKNIALGFIYIIEGISLVLYGLLSVFPGWINPQGQRLKWNKWFTLMANLQIKLFK